MYVVNLQGIFSAVNVDNFFASIVFGAGPVEELERILYDTTGDASFYHEAWYAASRITSRNHYPLYWIHLRIVFASPL